jgi:hypothetical protein
MPPLGKLEPIDRYQLEYVPYEELVMVVKASM